MLLVDASGCVNTTRWPLVKLHLLALMLMLVCLTQDMMDACISSGVFQGEVKFTGSDASGLGKQVNNSKTLARLNWQPKYSSFKEFMSAGGKDFYNTCGLF